MTKRGNITAIVIVVAALSLIWISSSASAATTTAPNVSGTVDVSADPEIIYEGTELVDVLARAGY